MTIDSINRESLRLCLTMAGLSTCALLLLLAVFYLFFAKAARVVTAQNFTVGEMLLDEALRFEHKRDELLLKATNARFQGTKNYRHLYFELAKYPVGKLKAEECFAIALADAELAKKDPALWSEANNRYLGFLLLSKEERHRNLVNDALDKWEESLGSGPDGILRTALDTATINFYRGVQLKSESRKQALVLFKKAAIDGYGPPFRMLCVYDLRQPRYWVRRAIPLVGYFPLPPMSVGISGRMLQGW